MRSILGDNSLDELRVDRVTLCSCAIEGHSIVDIAEVAKHGHAFTAEDWTA